jgi:transposase
LICPKFVAAIRQTQKTDTNDALAIIQASLLPEVRFVSGKNIELIKIGRVITANHNLIQLLDKPGRLSLLFIVNI